ncbi:hypothetical protein WN51_07999 [Melipona quadrifasciata]|uniref:Uncharacterized protein n=1 Tax=Melipona quadrifasciata TaxID=166423 RepID=A0A0M8ZR63_9HYME|nr:hypothetical protein WN51_07999 [Melipona quadrifasciata]
MIHKLIIATKISDWSIWVMIREEVLARPRVGVALSDFNYYLFYIYTKDPIRILPIKSTLGEYLVSVSVTDMHQFGRLFIEKMSSRGNNLVGFPSAILENFLSNGIIIARDLSSLLVQSCKVVIVNTVGNATIQLQSYFMKLVQRSFTLSLKIGQDNCTSNRTELTLLICRIAVKFQDHSRSTLAAAQEAKNNLIFIM